MSLRVQGSYQTLPPAGSCGIIAEVAVTVSICIPTYNGARYLKECLDSALAQTFRDFEVVVVDDGSTDSTMDVARQYSRSDARLRIWKNERNLGLVENWNRCVRLATGAWVKFLFQDDLLEPSCLERMLQASRDGVDLVAARRAMIFEDDTTAANKDRYRSYLAAHDLARHCPGQDHVTAEQFAEILLRYPSYNCIGEPTATLIRRSAFERYGRFNRDLIMLCDWEHSARVAVNTGLCYIDTTLAHFRVHAGATSWRIRSRSEYRWLVIDPLIILHEMVYSKHYATARAVAKRLRPPANLRSRLVDDVRKARREAWARKDDVSRSDWRRALRRYPRLAWLQLGNVLRSAATAARVRGEG
jgi:glycosyltransferase involved in cell wall biosynthesis